MIRPTALNVGAITPLPEDGERALCVAAHGVDVTGFVDRGIASPQAHAVWAASQRPSR